MTDDVNARMLDIDPTIPHHLVRKIAIFWQTHRVNLAAPAKVLSAAKVSIRIRKDDRRSLVRLFPAVHANSRTSA